MYTDSDGSSDSEEELSQFNLLGTDTVPTSLAVTRYDNELFNNDDLDEVELGADLSSSVDTERSGNSTVLSSTLDDRATELEQIKDLAARRRKEKLLFRCTVSSNDFVLPRTSLTEGRRWGAGPLQKGPVSSCGGRGGPVVGASKVTGNVATSNVPVPLPDSLRSQHAKRVHSSLPTKAQPSDAKLEVERIKSEEAKEIERQLLQQGIAPVYDPDCRESTSVCKPRTAQTDITDIRTFVSRPGLKDAGVIQCHIRREVPANWLPPRYKLYLTEGDHFLLAARKRKGRHGNYIISLDEDDITSKTGNFFGKVQSNFLGTEFWFYDKGMRPNSQNERLHQLQISERMELGAVTYRHNVLGMRGPRKMVALIPEVDDDDKPFTFGPKDDGSHTILKKYNLREDRDKMVVMHNKEPKWNAEIGAYSLNFSGRVTRASVKNFQLVSESDKDCVILQFGKVGRNFFTMDYRHPMSALQAFMISLSSLDSKLACE